MARSDSSDSRSRHKKHKRKYSKDSSSSDDKKKSKSSKLKINNRFQSSDHRLSHYQTHENHQRFNKEKNQRPKEKGKAPKIQMVLSKPESDIKYHFKFKDLHLDYQNIVQTCQSLKIQITGCAGPVACLEQTSSKKNLITLGLGFKYDSDALSYYARVNQGMYLQIVQNRQSIRIIPQVTEVFKCYLPFLTEVRKTNQKQNQHEKHQRQNERNSSQNYSRTEKKRYDSSASQEKRKKNDRNRKKDSSSSQKHDFRRIKEYSNNQNYHKNHQHQNKGDYKKILIFGLSTSVKSIEITQFLNKNQFQSKSFIWKRMKNSICQYLELIMESNKAQRFLESAEYTDIKGNPFIAIIWQSQDQNQILLRLKQFEVNIQFPYDIPAYNVLKGISNCGKIIQMISNNILTQKQTSSSYNIAFSSKKTASQLKKLGKLTTGIKIQDLEKGQLVYRPSSKNELYKKSQNL